MAHGRGGGVASVPAAAVRARPERAGPRRPRVGARPRPTATSRSRRSPRAPTRPASRSRWRCCRTGGVLHTSRDGRVWLTTPNATTSLAGTIPGLLARRGRAAGDRDRRRLRDQPLGLRLLRAAASHAGAATRRPTATRPATFAPFQGHNQLSRIKLTAHGTLDLAERAEDPPGPDRPRHLLPRRRRDRLRRGGQPLPLHRRRHEPVRVRRLRPDRRALRPATRPSTPSAPRRTRTTCAASCCASRSTPTARTRSPPATCSRPAAGHAARDLRDGLPQPVPLRGRRRDGLGLPRRLRPRRRRPVRRPAAPAARSSST